MASSQQSSDGRGATPGMYYCHMCNMEIRPLLTPQPTCPRCNGGFVEELESSRAGMETDDVLDDDDDGFGDLDRMWRQPGQESSGGLDLGQLMAGVLRNLASAGQDRPSTQRTDVPERHEGETTTNSDQTMAAESAGGSFRSGTTRFGPINVSWGVGSQTVQGGGSSGSGSGTGSGSGRSGLFGAVVGAPHMQAHTPTGHDDVVRRSLEEHARQHVHDDGMGGAGGAADGRFFNHDNTDEENEPSRRMPGATPSNDEPDLPPELASLRDVFSNLFGGLGDGPAGMLMDMLGGAIRGGRSGDYVWGQQGLDDVISQLMEQTRGSTAPPPASDDTIAKLERFSRTDKAKVRQARNRECSTCMDSFEEEEEEDDGTWIKTNVPTGLRSVDDADDPPEQVPQDEQQDELVMMPCRHLFHQDCIIPWLKTSSTCPVCRVSVEPKHEQERQQQGGESSGSNRDFASSPAAHEFFDPLLRPAPFTSAAMPEQREDTDVEEDTDMEEDSADQRRERTRRAAEARMHGQSNESQGPYRQARLPGSFVPPDDLD